MRDEITAGARLRAGASCALFGALVGAIHGLVDVDLLRLTGLQLTWADAVIEAGAFALGGGFGGAALGLILALIRPRWAAESTVRHTTLLGGAALAYAVAVAFTVGGMKGVGFSVVGLAAAALVISKARKTGHGLAAAGAAVAISGAFCALFFLGVEWNEAAESSRWSLVGVTAALVEVTALFYFASSRLKAPAAAGFVAWALLSLLWVQMAPIERYAWRTIEREPTLGGGVPAGGNLLLVVLDTVRADHMDLFGYERPTMPLLTARARRDFDVVMKSEAASSWTLPAHATMFTGLHPWKHGAHRASVADPNPPASAYPLRPDARVLADVMGEAGYRTADVAANFAILSGFGLTAGFEHADITPGTGFLFRRLSWLYRMSLPPLPVLGYPVAHLAPNWLKRLSSGFSDRIPEARRAAEITAAASDWLDGNGDRPFFLFVNYLDAHAPYLPLPEDDELFAPRPADELPPSDIKTRFMDQLRGVGKVSAEQLAFVEGQYDAEMVGLDRGLEALFAGLEQSGDYDDTLIIVTSDHGEAFTEHGIWGHETSLYEDQIGVPLLIKLPAGHADDGALATPTMQHVDLLPTITHVLGLETPTGLQGSAWGAGRDYALSELYCYVCRSEPESDEIEMFRRDMTAVTVNGHKAILSTRDAAKYYDLAADPGEQSPLADPAADFVERAAKVVGSREIYVSDSSGDTDPEMVEKLKSLGYIQ